MSERYHELKLEKGMYRVSGKSFTQVLEASDPTENYRGTPLEGVDWLCIIPQKIKREK